jgi:hypothetical protein
MNDEKEIIKKAVNEISGQTGLQISYNQSKTGDYNLEIISPKGGKTQYHAQVIRNFSNAKLGTVLINAKRTSKPFS